MSESVSIVIPVFEEEESLPYLYASITEAMDPTGRDYEMLFVDDGSRDATLKVLSELNAKDNRVVVVSFRRNFGQTAAMAAGIDHATGDIIVTMDADLQNDPADIPHMLEKAKEFDVVSGWRKRRKDPFISRKLPSLIANGLISKVTGVKLHDYGCTLKAYRKEVIKNVRLYGEMHRFIPAIANWYGASITEVETTHHERKYGKSKYGISRTIRVILDLITVKFLQTFATRPIHAFGPIGLALGAIGFLIALYLSFDKVILGHSIGSRPLLLLSVLLIILGVQILVMGLLAEVLARTYHESQGKPIYTVKLHLGSSPLGATGADEPATVAPEQIKPKPKPRARRGAPRRSASKRTENAAGTKASAASDTAPKASPVAAKEAPLK
ncbi:MAG: glycosyltransferase family 2 protein [Proteobacteria bacterium]|nr:glycosyltransferase family 2 protein [Pseudomonadota bacterium]